MFIDDDFEIIPYQIKKDEINKILNSLTKISVNYLPANWWKIEYIRDKHTTHKKLKWWQEEYIKNKFNI